MNLNTIKKSFLNHGFVVVKNVLSTKQLNEIFTDLEKIKKLVLKKVSNIIIFLQMENLIQFIISTIFEKEDQLLKFVKNLK